MFQYPNVTLFILLLLINTTCITPIILDFQSEVGIHDMAAQKLKKLQFKMNDLLLDEGIENSP